MTTDRRDFLARIAAGAALGALPLSDALGAFAPPASTRAAPWDLSWVGKITGKHRAVFDIPAVESGYGVWRASVWAKQYVDVLGAKPADISTVVVLRHDGLALAFQQAFWDRHKLSTMQPVMHPVTMQATDRNPALLASSRGEQPADFDELALDRFIARGGIVLACNLALDFLVAGLSKAEGAAPDAIRRDALASFVPGVILQPSGVFGVIRAQDAGCHYIRAS
jgi:hypothetical protein